MKETALPVDRYIGADIVPEIIAQNIERYAAADREFIVCDVVNEVPPRADLVLCRDCLVHLSHDEIHAVLENFRRSGATWLLTTTFTNRDENWEIETGDWRPINLELAPYNLPAPVELLNEQSNEIDPNLGAFPDKSLGLWHLGDLASR